MAPKVLMVDDDPLIRRLYERHVTGAGYRFITAGNAREGIAAAASELPQVIVMDMLMPDMDGLTALRQLKKDQATQSIPVIVMSGDTEHEISRREAEAAGAAFFLSKPFSAKQLLAHLERLAPVPQPTSISG